MAETVATIIM